MNGEPPGLVHHHHAFVLIEDGDGERRGKEARAVPAYQDLFPAFQPVARLHLLSPYFHGALLEEPFRERPGNPELLGQKPIHPFARGFLTHK